MSEDTEPGQTDPGQIEQLSHRRILILMAMVVLLGGILSIYYVSGLFAVGFLTGGILSFVNYYWLKASLKRVFDEAGGGQRPRVSATRYILRYFTIAAILGIVFLTKTVPVAAVIFGLTSFALAVVVEAVIRIVLIALRQKEI